MPPAQDDSGLDHGDLPVGIGEELTTIGLAACGVAVAAFSSDWMDSGRRRLLGRQRGGRGMAAAEVHLVSVRKEHAPVPYPGAFVKARRFPLLSGDVYR